MDPILLVVCVCFLGMLILIGWEYQRRSATPQMDLREKLKNLAKDPEAMAREIELGQEKKSLLAAVDFRSIFARFTGQSYMEVLERELTQSDVPLKPGEFLLARIGVAGFAFLVTVLMAHNFVAAIAAAAFTWLLKVPFMKIKRSMRITKFVTQLAEFLILITNSLRSGQTFLQGVDIASRESPNPIGMEFRLLLKETNLGVPVETAFSNMLIRVPSEDLKIVMSAFSIQRNVGGNLADIMDQVAAMIRQRIQIQGQIRVLTTQGKLSGAIVGLLPFGLGAVIYCITPDYMSRLWIPRHGQDLSFTEKFLGPILLLGGILLQLLGCVVIWKICDIEV